MFKLSIVTALAMGVIFYPKFLFAYAAPSLHSPTNGSQISSTKLEWVKPDFELAADKPYNIIVDNNEDFSSPEKDYDTNNIYYTPNLTEGTWYWKVRAKDINENYTSWSESWSFIFSTQSNQQPSSSSAQIQPNSPEPSTSPSPSTQPQGGSPQFQISNVPQSVDVNQAFSVYVNLAIPTQPNTKFYLKGAFIKSGSSNYFGQTKVSGSWIPNNSNYSTQAPITTDSNGNWYGSLEVLGDPNDSGFSGEDNYIFKVARYTHSGSGPTWSSDTQIHISGNPVDEESNESASKSPKPSPSPSPKLSTSQAKSLSGSTVQSIPLSNIQNESSVAGISTQSALINSSNLTSGPVQKINWWFIFAGLSIFTATTIFLLKNIKIQEWLLKAIPKTIQKK